MYAACVSLYLDIFFSRNCVHLAKHQETRSFRCFVLCVCAQLMLLLKDLSERDSFCPLRTLNTMTCNTRCLFTCVCEKVWEDLLNLSQTAMKTGPVRANLIFNFVRLRKWAKEISFSLSSPLFLFSLSDDVLRLHIYIKLVSLTHRLAYNYAFLSFRRIKCA